MINKFLVIVATLGITTAAALVSGIQSKRRADLYNRYKIKLNFTGCHGHDVYLSMGIGFDMNDKETELVLIDTNVPLGNAVRIENHGDLENLNMLQSIISDLRTMTSNQMLCRESVMLKVSEINLKRKIDLELKEFQL
tara:strand:- start:117350 stop:117763 length:414 start_codon:yes stop_codon:yes gene_type:complete